MQNKDNLMYALIAWQLQLDKTDEIGSKDYSQALKLLGKHRSSFLRVSSRLRQNKLESFARGTRIALK